MGTKAAHEADFITGGITGKIGGDDIFPMKIMSFDVKIPVEWNDEGLVTKWEFYHGLGKDGLCNEPMWDPNRPDNP